MQGREGPDYLIIGAMKSGTTSLFFDLAAHPGVFLPPDKEPHALAPEAYFAGEPPTYRELAAGKRDDQIWGDASTGYSKKPDVEGVPERALERLGPELRIIYLVREPVARLVSQHYHELADGTAEHADIDVAVRETPRLVQYGLYAFQIEPWVEVFGAGRVRVVQFERYIADREGVVRELLSFLGLDPAETGPLPDRDANPNPSSRALSKRGLFWRASRGRLYRALIRPRLPRGARSVLKRHFLPSAPVSPAPPSLETVELILARAAEDAARLPSLIGGGSPVPRWNFAAVRARYERPAP